jgi:hypothetical protein
MLLSLLQIAAYCVSALAGGIMFYRWLRLGQEEKQRVWRLYVLLSPQCIFCNILARYGWFSALMLCGSCVGVVTWAARMMTIVSTYNGADASTRATSPFSSENAVGAALVALGHSWRAVFSVTYAIEFLCLTAAKLMVLERMSDFAAPQVPSNVSFYYHFAVSLLSCAGGRRAAAVGCRRAHRHGGRCAGQFCGACR